MTRKKNNSDKSSNNNSPKKSFSKKGKSKKRESTNLPSQLLEKRIIDLLSKQVTTRFDAKAVIQKLKISNSLESVQAAMEKLTEKGSLEPSRGGKYKWNKDAKKPAKSKGDDKTAIGIADVTKTGSAYIVCDGMEKDIFVHAGKLMSAMHGDTVEVSYYLSSRGKPEGRVTNIIQRRTEQFIGSFKKHKGFAFVTPDNPTVQLDILVDAKTLPEGVEDGDKVVVSITKWHTDYKGNPEGVITTNFGQEGSNDVEMQSILIQKGFNLTFPKEVLEENEKIDTRITPAEIAKRRDMRGITTFTIDPETAKDFDDALSIQLLDNGNYEIGVHIADVTHYVKPDSELDKEAARRTTSVYLVDRVLPMLPENLSNGVCSLRPHEEKLTFSVVFEFDRQGDIVNEWFGKTVTYSDRRFSYEEAQEGLETGEGDFAAELKILNHYAHLLRKKRFKDGSINFDSPEVRFVLDEEGKPLDVYLKTRKDSNLLIEDYMLLANKRVGALIAGLHEKLGFQWPMIYRIHDEPDMEKVMNFVDFATQMGYPMKINSPDQVKKAFGTMLKDSEGKPESDVLQQLAIRTMAKAVYSSTNIGHYGLGFTTYSHFTSPIRRYADVLAHRILFDYLSDNNKRMHPVKLEDACKHISKKERDAMEAERDSIKYKQAEFLEEHQYEVFEGIISGIADHGIYVSIKANFCEGMVRYDKMYDKFSPTDSKYFIKSEFATLRMGDSVWVRILSANKYKKQVDLELLDPESIENLPPAKPQLPLKKEKTVPVTPSNVVREKATLELKPKSNREQKTVAIAQNKAYEKLLKDIAAIYPKSDIKTIADKKQVKWFYELTSSAPLTGSILLLNFNPIAERNKGYRGQKLLSQHPANPQGATKAFIKTYLDEQDVSEGYFSPFRSLDEKQLSVKDLELSLPIFKAFITLQKPSQIISFSITMLETMLEHDLLTDLVEEEVSAEERTTFISKAVLNIDGQSIPIHFLPKPTSRVSKALKDKAWAWALKPELMVEETDEDEDSDEAI